ITLFPGERLWEMKSLWNWGSITCIMYLIWEGSQRSMSSSRASSFSGPLHRWGQDGGHPRGSVSPSPSRDHPGAAELARALLSRSQAERSPRDGSPPSHVGWNTA
uniref:Uncharacterized protein n=1 Tax=Calidris pygmaea TaxID=425635 RepID=A0A8C3JUK1_9CHAR